MRRRRLAEPHRTRKPRLPRRETVAHDKDVVALTLVPVVDVSLIP